MTTLTRAQMHRKVGIDTTVKSAPPEWRALAPSWEMVLGHKKGIVTDAEYTRRYQDILARVPASVWDALAAQPSATVLCYCRDGWFCHTHLIIEYAVRHFPDRFQDGRPLEGRP